MLAWPPQPGATTAQQREPPGARDALPPTHTAVTAKQAHLVLPAPPTARWEGKGSTVTYICADLGLGKVEHNPKDQRLI